MTGQIDIGWSVVPFALKDVDDGKIRIVARSSDATELKNQTIRANLANVNSLKNRRETITKFMEVDPQVDRLGLRPTRRRSRSSPRT